MEYERPAHPERTFFGLSLKRRRNTITENRESEFTSSLPSTMFRSDSKEERNPRSATLSLPRTSLTIQPSTVLVEDEFLEDIDDDSLSRSFSSNLSLAPQRPRSASLHSHQLSPSLQGLKRTFGRPSLSRSRPSSARFSSSKGSRFSSPSMEQENKAMTGKVEAGFAAVKKQLTDLSAEDALLQERMDKLSSEIAALQQYVSGLVAAKRESDGIKRCATIGTPVKQYLDIPSPILGGEPWEDFISGVPESSPFLSVSGPSSPCYPHHHHHHHHFNLQLPYGSDGNDSTGSLADSEGSVSSPSGIQSTCSIIVVDHDKEVMSLMRSSSKPYEDDVFLS